MRGKSWFLLFLNLFFILLLFVRFYVVGDSEPKQASQDENIEFSQLPISTNTPVVVRSPRTADGQLLLMIFCHNVLEEFGPTYCYQRIENAQALNVSNIHKRMIMCNSLNDCQSALSYSGELEYAGYNPEGGHTPGDEMNRLGNNDDSNPVCQFSRMATARGVIPIVGPIRNTVSRLPAAFLVKNCGLRGIAMQEQKAIEDPGTTAQGRYDAVVTDMQPYVQAGKEIGVNVEVHVQIMETRCPDMNKCIDFVQKLTANPDIWSLAIWSNGPISPSFVQRIRMKN